jgi:outer membrane protease
VTTTRTITVALVRAVAAFALSLATAAPVAADWTRSFAPPTSYVGEFGMRFWFGRAQTKKDLYDTTGSFLVSRLDYYDMNIFTGEAYSRLDFNNGWFIKGYFGGGGLFGGQLRDEDFPPVTVPYSATLSDNKSGSLIYGSVDGGIKLVRGPDFHVGAFVGYHFMRDYVDAMGCTQVAAHPGICVPAIPDTVRGISQTNNWHSLRLGLEASVEFDRRWKFTVDAAWVPYAALYGADTHFLRIGTNPGDFHRPDPRGRQRLGLSDRRHRGLPLQRLHQRRRRRPLLARRSQGPYPLRKPRGRVQRRAAGRALAGRPLRRLHPGQYPFRSLPAHQRHLVPPHLPAGIG